uniref:Toxin candidate TRINITY_DN18814_c0_g1_i2.p1 n=1 Tax=Ceriantheomorphe brasiliensis TaxID=1048506 RepID=A0A7G7WYW0_9CNID|nr:toxin candidate TRINITY_DN18814_c0_g1_i2.p1 [Ceriantheomorphe brasiliensis]
MYCTRILFCLLIVYAFQTSQGARKKRDGDASARTSGPFFNQIAGVFYSPKFLNLFKAYEALANNNNRRSGIPHPSNSYFIHIRVVNHVGRQIKLTPDKLLQPRRLKKNEVFIYHQEVEKKYKNITINFRGEIDGKLRSRTRVNGEYTVSFSPHKGDNLVQEIVVSKSGNLGHKWLNVKFINQAGSDAKLFPDQILGQTMVAGNELFDQSVRMDRDHEDTRVLLKVRDAATNEPLQLNGEYTMFLRAATKNDLNNIKITRAAKLDAGCDHFVERENTKYEYQFSSTPLNWFDADRACKVCKGNLVSIENREENAYLTKQLKSVEGDVFKMWTGMNFEDRSMQWTWDDGKRYRYTNWHNGQQYHGRDEQCGFIYKEKHLGKWEDENCYKPLPYICKRSKATDNPKNLKPSVEKEIKQKEALRKRFEIGSPKDNGDAAKSAFFNIVRSNVPAPVLQESKAIAGDVQAVLKAVPSSSKNNVEQPTASNTNVQESVDFLDKLQSFVENLQSKKQ